MEKKRNINVQTKRPLFRNEIRIRLKGRICQILHIGKIPRERDETSAMVLYQAVMNDSKLQKQGGRITIAKANDASITAALNQPIRMDAVLFGNMIRSGRETK